MHWTLRDRGDDPDARSHESTEIRDLTGHVKTDLDHRHLVTRLDAQECHWDADLVVEGGCAAQHAVAGAECRRGGFLRRRLPDVAGDADGRDRVGVAKGLGQPAERVLRVGHLDQKSGVGEIVNGSLHHRGSRPVRERVGHEPMAIATVAEREEHAPGLRDARIERAPSEAVRQVRDAVDHPSTRRAEHLLEGEHALPNGTVGGLRPPAPGPPHGRSGCTRAYLSASVAMPLKAVIAGRVPSSFDSGRSRTTTTTSCGSSAGTNPANDEMYASST